MPNVRIGKGFHDTLRKLIKYGETYELVLLESIVEQDKIGKRCMQRIQKLLMLQRKHLKLKKV